MFFPERYKGLYVVGYASGKWHVEDNPNLPYTEKNNSSYRNPPVFYMSFLLRTRDGASHDTFRRN
jgi:hypothetical protein